jgi:hypothetical protein
MRHRRGLAGDLRRDDLREDGISGAAVDVGPVCVQVAPAWRGCAPGPGLVVLVSDREDAAAGW